MLNLNIKSKVNFINIQRDQLQMNDTYLYSLTEFSILLVASHLYNL